MGVSEDDVYIYVCTHVNIVRMYIAVHDEFWDGKCSLPTFAVFVDLHNSVFTYIGLVLSI